MAFGKKGMGTQDTSHAGRGSGRRESMGARDTSHVLRHPSGTIECVGAAFSKYATFSGRARRPEFWWFALFWWLVCFTTSFLDMALFDIAFENWGLLWSLFVLFTLLPYLAVTARRLHDTGRSGWWQLLPLMLPVIGAFIDGFIGGFVEGYNSVAERDNMTLVPDVSDPHRIYRLSGWLALIALIVLTFWYAQRGEDEANRYGRP